MIVRMKGNRLNICGVVLLLLIALSLITGCAQKDKDEAKPPAGEKAAEPEAHVKHGTNGETIVTFDAATQKLMGLQTTALQPAQLAPELKGYGHVLDVAPLTTLVSDLMAARAASAASQAEVVRLKTLAAQNNASERSLQAAEAAAARDQSQAESARLRLLSAWGRAIAELPDLPAFVQSLSALTSALVQLDLPAGQPVSGLPTGARVVTLPSSWRQGRPYRDSSNCRGTSRQALNCLAMRLCGLMGRLGFTFKPAKRPLNVAKSNWIRRSARGGLCARG